MEIPKNASILNLSNLGLQEIPKEVFKCRFLKKLDLSHNNIKVLPKDIGKLKFLQSLDLSNNQLTALFANLFNISALRVLILNNNQISKIPQQLGNLTNLTKLMVANNKLASLPESLTDCKKLISLDISKNLFEKFPEILLTSSKLKNLWIGKNNFSNFPSQRITTDLPSLKTLYCFSPVSDSVLNADNDYKTLQQKSGNSLETLRLINRQSISTITRSKPTTNKIFISYSHRDKTYKEEIEIALRGIQYLGLDLTFWSDTQLDAGDLLKETIQTALEEAGIVINIVSIHYLASKFIQAIELPRMLEKAESDGVLILNVIAGSCVFDKTALYKFLAVNEPKKPLAGETPSGQDDVYLVLTQRVIKALEKGRV